LMRQGSSRNKWFLSEFPSKLCKSLVEVRHVDEMYSDDVLAGKRQSTAPTH
jgi:hypothetical protein